MAKGKREITEDMVVAALRAYWGRPAPTKDRRWTPAAKEAMMSALEVAFDLADDEAHIR